MEEMSESGVHHPGTKSYWAITLPEDFVLEYFRVLDALPEAYKDWINQGLVASRIEETQVPENERTASIETIINELVVMQVAASQRALAEGFGPVTTAYSSPLSNWVEMLAGRRARYRPFIEAWNQRDRRDRLRRMGLLASAREIIVELAQSGQITNAPEDLFTGPTAPEMDYSIPLNDPALENAAALRVPFTRSEDLPPGWTTLMRAREIIMRESTRGFSFVGNSWENYEGSKPDDSADSQARQIAIDAIEDLQNVRKQHRFGQGFSEGHPAHEEAFQRHLREKTKIILPGFCLFARTLSWDIVFIICYFAQLCNPAKHDNRYLYDGMILSYPLLFYLVHQLSGVLVTMQGLTPWKWDFSEVMVFFWAPFTATALRKILEA